MMSEGERSLTINFFLILILWGFGSYVLIVQTNNLPLAPPVYFQDEHPALFDPDWYVFDLSNGRMTFIENFFSYGFFFLGLLRLMSIMTALGVIEREERWADFWKTCECGQNF